MIAIWRRTKKAVGSISDGEWALLALESLGVVVGILIAFQLDSWNENRKEARAQAELVERLFDESEQIVASIRTQSEFFADMNRGHQQVAQIWFTGSRCPTSSELASLGTTNFYPALEFDTAAYDEMIGSGGLSRLPSADLRRAVSSFHSEAEAYTSQLEYFRDVNSRREQSQEDEFGAYPLMDPETGAVQIVGQDVSRACGDTDYKLYMYGRIRNFGVMQTQREAMLDSAIAMCRALGEEVGRACGPAEGFDLGEEDPETGAA